MTIQTVRCPACGLDQVAEPQASLQTFRLPYGEPVEAERVINTCLACHETWTLREPDPEMEEAARKSSVRAILAYFEREEIELAYIERVLRIPQGTLQHWGIEGCSPAEAALLALLRAFLVVLLAAADQGLEQQVDPFMMLLGQPEKKPT